MEIETMPPEWHLAAALHLLSATALRGASAAKTAAMLAHLERLCESPELDPVLKDTIADLMQAWGAHDGRAAGPLAHASCPAHSLH